MAIAGPILFTILVWWLSTGLVLQAVNRDADTYPAALAAASGLLIVGFLGLYASASNSSVLAAYVGFLSALAIWTWHEMTFLMGIVTGPRTIPAKHHMAERAPLADATATVIYHEVALAITAVFAVALTWGAENQTGTWTFLAMWALRLSTKINIYLGVPNLMEEFLPPHLKYLHTYFCRRPMNLFFPVSVTAATVATLALAQAALDAGPNEGAAASYGFLAALVGLALLEHWFLVIPFRSSQLWTWGLQKAPPAQGDEKAGLSTLAIKACPAPQTRGAA